MVFLTRKEHFNAAHRLSNPKWTDEQNEKVFGKCANKNWHGHNYELYVTVKGEPDPDTGFIVNVHELSQIIIKHITDKLDHKNLNLDVAFMKGILPSAEHLAKGIWKQLEPHIKGCKLHSIKLYETESIFVEYFGD